MAISRPKKIVATRKTVSAMARPPSLEPGRAKRVRPIDASTSGARPT